MCGIIMGGLYSSVVYRQVIELNNAVENRLKTGDGGDVVIEVFRR